jgi:hypothetical protein
MSTPKIETLTVKREQITFWLSEMRRLSNCIDGLLNHCPNDECLECSKIVCPEGEALHLHHDGCPACDGEHPTVQAEREMEEALLNS